MLKLKLLTAFLLASVCPSGDYQVASGGGGLSGSGAIDRITYWSGASTLTGSADFTYDGTDLTLLAGDTNLGGNLIVRPVAPVEAILQIGSTSNVWMSFGPSGLLIDSRPISSPRAGRPTQLGALLTSGASTVYSHHGLDQTDAAVGGNFEVQDDSYLGDANDFVKVTADANGALTEFYGATNRYGYIGNDGTEMVVAGNTTADGVSILGDLEVANGLRQVPTIIDSDDTPYTALATTNLIVCDPDAGAAPGTVAITLPASTGGGRRFVVKNISTTARDCTVTGNGGEEIDNDGGAGQTISAGGSLVVIDVNQTDFNWIIE